MDHQNGFSLSHQIVWHSPKLALKRFEEKIRYLESSEQDISHLRLAATMGRDRVFMLFVCMLVDSGARKSESLVGVASLILGLRDQTMLLRRYGQLDHMSLQGALQAPSQWISASTVRINPTW